MYVSYSFIIVTVQNSQDELKTTNHTTNYNLWERDGLASISTHVMKVRPRQKVPSD